MSDERGAESMGDGTTAAGSLRADMAGRGGASLVDRAERVAEEVVGPAASDVDRNARFPKEALEALRSERLLSVLAPARVGGEGASYGEVARIVASLSKRCASTGMIYAMHQIQVACLVRHGRTVELDRYLRDEVVAQQALLASATTEAGVGGDVRTSLCAVEEDGEHFHLEKNAPVISYGAYADAILVTARRCPDSPPSDQVLVLCRRDETRLEPTSGWDTLGFRGTCSPGFMLVADGPIASVLPEPYAEISALTMLPVSHLLWSHVWLGIAEAAVSTAHQHVRNEARKKPGTVPPAAMALSELMALHLQFAALTRDAARRYDELAGDRDALGSLDVAIGMNLLKVSASTLVVEIVTRAMRICGMTGYREDSPSPLGRLLRDAHGAALMVNNDRILANSAQMLLVSKSERA
jgi:acyl-CoA dehydrogenase